MYLRNYNGFPGFVSDEDRVDSDVKIVAEDYNKYFELERAGKSFKMKQTPTGSGLFDYIEEYVPAPMPGGLDEIQKLKVTLAEVTEEMERNKVEFQLAIAEVVEAQSQTAPTSY